MERPVTKVSELRSTNLYDFEGKGDFFLIGLFFLLAIFFLLGGLVLKLN